MVPLVHDSVPHWMPATTLRFLHTIVMSTVAHIAPSAPKAWGAHLACTTAKAVAPLMHAASMIDACGMRLASCRFRGLV